MKSLLRLLLKSEFRRGSSPDKTISGFTMIELLVGSIMAVIITVPLLSFVVNILNTDVQEEAKTNSEQDMQAAVNYIEEDVSQAIYIYDPNDAGFATFASNLASNGQSPVLVFWKREFVEDAVCSTGDCDDGRDDGYVLALVAYYEITENDPNSIWCQPSQTAGTGCPQRITRLQIKDGVRDMSGNFVAGDDGVPDDGFAEFDSSNYLAWTPNGTITKTPEVLVNYIENFTVNSVTNNNLAQITVEGNAKRRLPGQFNTVDCNQPSPYCPEITAQVGKRSGLGE
jgi:type II secretory pathway pseudopilin PulG